MQWPYSAMWTERALSSNSQAIPQASFKTAFLPGFQEAYSGFIYTKWFALLDSPIISSTPGKTQENQNVFHLEALEPGNAHKRHNKCNERIKQKSVLNMKDTLLLFP